MSYCLAVLLASCACPEPIVKPETVTIEKEIILPVPARLTAPIDIPQMCAVMDTLALGALYKQTVTGLMVCNGQLSEIRGLVEPKDK